MTDARNNLKALLKSAIRLTKDPRFWAVQFVVIATAVVHNLLEVPGSTTTSDLADFLPISFLWVPLVYSALRFGLAGSSGTSAVVILSSMPNWLYFQNPETMPQEVSLVVIAVAISLVIARQVDRRSDAQQRAKVYAASAVRRQEDDQKQLSLLLHDDAVQTLISSCYRIDAMKNKISPAERDWLDLREEITGVVENLRSVAIGLRPPMLDDRGLTPALQSLLNDTAKRKGFHSEFSVSGIQCSVPPDTEIAIFRIAQEALRNVERHALASHVSVALVFGGHNVTLNVMDDGIGFNPGSREKSKAGNHLGLISMRERAEMCGGTLRVISSPHNGTTITARIPV